MSQPNSPPSNLVVAPSPHIHNGIFTPRIMFDVVLALLPLAAWGVYSFGLPALMHILICVVAAPLFEALFNRLAGKKSTLGDGSAIVTGLILALSLPAAAPWFISVIACLVAIGLGKFVFGGLGQNIFNPAMVGRAFVMIGFSQYVGGQAYMVQKTAEGSEVIGRYITQATPLSGGTHADLWQAFVGMHNGSIGETSGVLILLGFACLLYRRVIAWDLPLAAIATFVVLTGLGQIAFRTLPLETLKNTAPLLAIKLQMTTVQHLFAGSFLFGCVFIITDPVTNPMSRLGRILFGAGFACLVWIFRIFSSYPEGVMFAVLIMNACSPLLDRFCVPKPVGGPLPAKKKV